jgi:hypothetical protein
MSHCRRGYVSNEKRLKVAIFHILVSHFIVTVFRAWAKNRRGSTLGNVSSTFHGNKDFCHHFRNFGNKPQPIFLQHILFNINMESDGEIGASWLCCYIQDTSITRIIPIWDCWFLCNQEGYGLHFTFFSIRKVQFSRYETLGADRGPKISPTAWCCSFCQRKRENEAEGELFHNGRTLVKSRFHRDLSFFFLGCLWNN